MNLTATRTRFAPSPTGLLHVGNARTALFCYLFARAAKGEFMLRLDDTDRQRSTDIYAQAIIDDLNWLGLTHDIMAKQSDHFANYEKAFDTLQAAGLVYPCYETQDELERKHKRQLARGKPPIYDRAALLLTEQDKKTLEAEGKQPHWRFKLSGKQIKWDDIIRGPQIVNTASLSDPVLRRADGTFLYTLPSVIDDMAFDISHVIRGEDHVTNSAAQIELIHALGGTPPQFAHHALLIMADGRALSKREGDLSLTHLREEGFEPMAVNSLLARLGTLDPIEAQQDLAACAAGFDLTRLGRAPVRFDMEELARVNAKLFHNMPFGAVADDLRALDIADEAEDFWLAVRDNLEKRADIAKFWAMIQGPIKPDIATEDMDYITAARLALPNEPWSEKTWGQWTADLQKSTGRKGKALFMPLRKALTGQQDGPEMQKLLLHIGAARAKTRLQVNE